MLYGVQKVKDLHGINNDGIDVVVYCKDDMSGASSENRKTIHIPSPSEGKEVETSCVDDCWK